MTTPNSKLPKINVSHSYHDLETPALASFAAGTKFTGSPAPTPPVADATILGYANTMMGTHNSRQTAPSKTATSNESTQRTILLTALDKNAAYLEGVANDAAIAAGDVEAGKAVVTAVGFVLAGKGGGKHHTGITGYGIGWVQAHEDKLAKGTEGHVWEFGAATAKGAAPAVTKDRFTLEATCIFNNIPSGTVFAYRHASIAPVGKKKKTGGGISPHTTPSSLRTAASLLPSNKGNHPVIDFNNASPYTFGDWRYVVIL